MSVKTNVEEMLVEKGIITRAQLERVKKVQFDHRDKSLTDIMLLLGYTTEAGILKCFSEKEADDVVCLDEKPADPAALAALPASFIRRNNVFPVCFAKGELVTAFTFPVDPHVLDEAEALSGMVIRPVLTSLDQMKTAIAGIGSTAEHENEDGKATEEKSESAPVIRLVNTLIESAYKRNASDIHIEALETKVRVRYRIDGALYEKMVYDNSLLPAISTRIKIMGGMDISEKRKPQDGRMSVMVDRREYDIRISSIPTVHGEKIVMRISSKLNLSRDIKELGLDQKEMATLQHMLAKPYGIMFVTGPTGSGKSTTLYTALSALNKEAVNIVTVEDPVEADLEGINQIQVNNKVDLTFASALRSILRQDPDIIMIGEIRDQETASIAVQASITGHLVVSTMHTNNAVGTLNRMADMGIARYLISDAIIGVIAQRLVRKLCPHCRKKRTATDKEKLILKRSLAEEVEIYEPGGCKLCNNTGFFGRTGVFEIMEVNEEMRKLIADDATTEEMIAAAKKNGMHTLRENGIRYVLEGVTSIGEMLKASYEE